MKKCSSKDQQVLAAPPSHSLISLSTCWAVQVQCEVNLSNMMISLAINVHQQFDGFFVGVPISFCFRFLGPSGTSQTICIRALCSILTTNIADIVPTEFPFQFPLPTCTRNTGHLFTCSHVSSAPLHLISPLWFRWFVVVASCAGFLSR